MLIESSTQELEIEQAEFQEIKAIVRNFHFVLKCLLCLHQAWEVNWWDFGFPSFSSAHPTSMEVGDKHLNVQNQGRCAGGWGLCREVKDVEHTAPGAGPRVPDSLRGPLESSNLNLKLYQQNRVSNPCTFFYFLRKRKRGC